jgi:class 3 adenylate cyclase/tetratricopeptide (TPR) repeat protein
MYLGRADPLCPSDPVGTVPARDVGLGAPVEGRPHTARRSPSLFYFTFAVSFLRGATRMGKVVSTIGEWLGTLGLPEYAERFAENRIDLSVLAELTDQDLEKLGVLLGDRRKMLRAIRDAAKGLTPAAVSPEPGWDVRAGTFAPPKSYTQAHLAEQVATARGALEGERKQVTVLFCDIADSTALAERIGAEAMHTLLNRFFELALGELHRFECTINQFGGDGFMALAPVAHEDHARRAVLAALGIQQALRERKEELGPGGSALAVRIGVHTGPVVVGTIGDNLRMDYTAIGDTTNLAARLQQHAEPGAILISEATWRLVRDDVQAEPLEPIAVKGKAKPVVSYRVLAAIPRRSPLRGLGNRALSEFVGRNRDLVHMLGLMAEVQEGRGHVVGIVGEPGAGKSRLLYELRQALAGRPATYLEGRCLSYGGSIPYVPVLDIIKQNFGVLETDSAETVTAKVRSGIEEVGLDPDEWGPILLLFLGVKEGTERLAALTPETIKARTFDMLRQLSLSGSRRQTLILAVEDLHWIDKTSEEYLGSLVDSLSAASILLICTYRPGYRPPWIDKSFATQTSLRPLSSRDSLRVVHSVVDARVLPERLAKIIVEKAEGNPLFLEELARSVGDRPDASATLAMPDTVQGVLQARIDRLADAPKRLLQTASVIGREVPLKLLRAVWEAPGSLDVHLLELKRQEFLHEKTAEGDRAYVFKHALTQDVAHDSLLTPARQALHEATACALEAIHLDRLEEYYERLAYHYCQTANRDKALEYLGLASQKAAKANAMQEAMAYFDQAMPLLDTMPDTESNRRRRVLLIVNQWIVFWQLFRVPEYYELLTRHQPMAAALGDSNLLAKFQLYVGHCQWVFGLLDQAVDTSMNAVRLNEAAGAAGGAGQACCMLQWTHLYLGNLEQALSWREPALHGIRQHFDLRWYAWSLGAASLTYSFLGRFDEAVDDARKALATAEEYRDNSMVSFAHWNLSLAYTSRGDVAKAIEHSQTAVEKAPTPADKAWAQHFLGWAWSRGDRAREGADLLATILPLYEATQFVPGQIFAGMYLGEAHWRAGQLDDAERTLRIALARAAGTYKFFIGFIQRLLGEIALERNPDQLAEPFAAPLFDASIAILRDIKAENELALAYAGYGRLHKAQRRLPEARDYFTRALEIFDRLGTLIEPDKVRSELVELNASD